MGHRFRFGERELVAFINEMKTDASANGMTLYVKNRQGSLCRYLSHQVGGGQLRLVYSSPEGGPGEHETQIDLNKPVFYDVSLNRRFLNGLDIDAKPFGLQVRK